MRQTMFVPAWTGDGFSQSEDSGIPGRVRVRDLSLTLLHFRGWFELVTNLAIAAKQNLRNNGFHLFCLTPPNLFSAYQTHRDAKTPKSNLTRSLRSDHGQWGIGRCRKAEKPAGIGNSRNSYRLRKNNGAWKWSRDLTPHWFILSSVGYNVENSFRKHFSWSTVTESRPLMVASKSRQAHISLPSQTEAISETDFLKDKKQLDRICCLCISSGTTMKNKQWS